MAARARKITPHRRIPSYYDFATHRLEEEMPNIQVTNDASANNARSESAIVVNPNNPLQIVASSKKFNNIHTYDFTLATAYSTDGGKTWNDSAAFSLPSGSTVMTDPTLTWDAAGNLYFVGLTGKNPPTFDTVGIVIYKSTDGGKTWGTPNLIHSSAGDDKQWVAGDSNPNSPFQSQIYAVWDDGSIMRFARTTDGGGTWIGDGTKAVAATNLSSSSFSPEINVAANGDVYIAWIRGTTVSLLVSTDGGDSFHAMPSPATGVTPSGAVLSSVHGWSVFPGGNFRMVTTATACVLGTTVIVAWDDFREGPSRIYYALSNDGGMSWASGASGKPLLTSTIPTNFQHFFPQIVGNPGGTIGCAFYEFGPKPSTNKIDVIFAQSLDGGVTFVPFVVTDQPWDPTVDAPWAHHGDSTPIDSSVTFIGDYFGIDASNLGFYPLWTDTRTGVQELFTDMVPERRVQILVERSTLGQDEIDARRKQPRNTPGGLPVPEAFRVTVDGFTAAEIGVTGSGSTLNVASPTAGIIITCTGNTAATGGYGSDVQRFTFLYDIDFPDDSAFGPDVFYTLSATVNATVHGRAASLSAQAQIELIKQPNPFILHGDPAWLSIDLRMFVIRQNDSLFGVPPLADAGDAPRFIRDIIGALNTGQGTAGGQSFGDPNVLSPDEEKSSLFAMPTDNNGKKVFNFALAKVHYIGLIGANDVRVFFRLFRTQQTYVPFDYVPGAAFGRYRRATTDPHGQPIPLAGIEGGEYVTFPFFATARVDSTAVSMNQQTDDANVQHITAQSSGAEVDAYFGCWLDTNQPFKADGVTVNNVLPLNPPGSNIDGPFSGATTIQQAILRNSHQCLIAEVAFDGTPIPLGKDPSNWDKLAQRNIIWSDIGSAEAVTTFEFRPTQLGLPIGQVPDELMIDWGKMPHSIASIYIPSQKAADILAMADRMYVSHRLTKHDDHTLQCPTGGITYVPVAPGLPINYPGLLSIDMPSGLTRGRSYTAVIRQVTNAFGIATTPSPPQQGEVTERAAISNRRQIEWRKVIGAFQLTVPVKEKTILLVSEERQLSVLKWIGETIPHSSRWYPVFRRYLHKLGGRVKTFGGDPSTVQPSPIGDPGGKGGAGGKGRGHGLGHERLECFTGKIAGLIFDRFGDFEGFLLETDEGDRKFLNREKEVAELAERVWRERLRITVCAERDEPHRPATIIVRQPPAHF
jgi:BNR/Asp-box repeat